MTTTTKTLVGVVVLASLLGVLAFFGVQIKSQAQSFGGFISGQVQQDAFLFVNGFSAGSAQQFLVSATGAVTSAAAWAQTAALTIGSSGTAVNNLNYGTCQLGSSATTIAASSSQTVTCGGGTNGFTALTGITSLSIVSLEMPSTTPTTFNGLSLAGVSASTTAGFITAIVTNNTGAAYTWATGATTSLNYIAVR